MHKLILKIFSLTKNFVYFLKIAAIFFLMLNLLLWIQNLIGGKFDWLQIFVPILNVFLGIGESVSKGSIDAFGAVFEFKYMIAVLIYIGLFYLFGFIIDLVEKLEDKYDDLRRYIKRKEEKICNITLRAGQITEEMKINKYKILVSTSLKKKFSHKELGYNIDEQNRLMNNFLTQQTGVIPISHQGGFLYEFSDFNSIDNILYTFFKLIKSNSPLDYVICVAIVESRESICLEEINQLMSLRHINKISMFSNCMYRYKFNKSHRFGTSQLGLFQKGNNTIEVHEFTEIM